MTSLRQRMVEDMQIRNLVPETQVSYVGPRRTVRPVLSATTGGVGC